MPVTFRIDEAEARFRARMPQTAEALPPADGIAAMLDFWHDTRCDDAAPEEEDGDGLLFQWGTYDWTNSKPPQPKFYLSISRQFYIVHDASISDIEIWHLRLEYEFDDAPDLAALQRGEDWCFARADLDRFRAFVQGSDALAAVAERTPRLTEIDFSPT